jgi:hypothetical protein
MDYLGSLAKGLAAHPLDGGFSWVVLEAAVMTIEDFIRTLAGAVAQCVAQGPPKQYTVNRVDDYGKPLQQVTTLPQLMAENNDLLKTAQTLQAEANRNSAEMIVVAGDLAKALNRNSHLAKKVIDRQEGK